MARRKRLACVGIPQHVIQRGNNKSVCFAEPQDFAVYAKWLAHYAEHYSVSIHAWVFMTNHVHLLCTPNAEKLAVSMLMQSIGRRYVAYFNQKYRRTGTLWEGRFKSTLVHGPSYLLALYKYIELNPVRAYMVSDPSDYKWSSYHANAMGKQSSFIDFHPLYLALGDSPSERQKVYREMFEQILERKILDEIRLSTHKEIVLGSEKFRQQLIELTGHQLKTANRGRPKRIA
jgi:putative transposase